MYICVSLIYICLNPKCVGKGGNDLSMSSGKVSSDTVPSVPQTNGEIQRSSNLKSFAFSELKEATIDFGPDALVEEGDFGSIYKGWIDEHSLEPVRPEAGLAIAVKMLNPNGCQGREELLTEIKFMGQLYHPNLVKLIGYCLEDDHRLLVYEFMSNGSLKNHLFGTGDSHFSPLSWNHCMKIALGAAKCLAFLHSEAEVIYRDFKTSNIMLDSNYNAKLSGLGLAKDGPIGCQSHVTTRVMGTDGYTAPEYFSTGHLAARSDVYSFGVVLLELLSGRQAIDRRKPSEEQNLVKWARNIISSRKISRVLNPAILGEHSGSSALKAAQLAYQCVSANPKARPNMKQVVQVLEQLQDSNDNKKFKDSQHCESSNGSIHCWKFDCCL